MVKLFREIFGVVREDAKYPVYSDCLSHYDFSRKSANPKR